jgi:hypothetical protein
VTGAKQELRPRIVIGWGPWASLRDQRWNCVLNPATADGQPKLYDLSTDPDEHVNVAAAHPEVVADCRRQLEGLIGSPFPVRFKHQPDAGDYMTLGSYFRRRAALGMPRFAGRPPVCYPESVAA